MQLTSTGESRVNGYLFVLERSLKTFLPSDLVRDAVREIESHLRERIANADGAPTERDALEKMLGELGPPLRVAQAYSVHRLVPFAVLRGLGIFVLTHRGARKLLARWREPRLS
jgi:HAAS domain-containing protein